MTTDVTKLVDGLVEKFNEDFKGEKVYGKLVGRSYIKIVEMTRSDPTVPGSVVAFVSLHDGNVYKPASWAAPAKHARGNVLNGDKGMSAFQKNSYGYSVYYLG